jgi:hypothetical protein
MPPKKTAKAKTSTQPARGRGRPKYSKTVIENIEVIANSNEIDNYESGKIEKKNEIEEEIKELLDDYTDKEYIVSGDDDADDDDDSSDEEHLSKKVKSQKNVNDIVNKIKKTVPKQKKMKLPPPLPM